jgi:hypothetical protein
LYQVDHPLLAGVPNTAFTEALAGAPVSSKSLLDATAGALASK